MKPTSLPQTTPQPLPLPPVETGKPPVYAVEVLRHDRPNWRAGTGNLTQCEDVLEALADLPMFAGAVIRIRQRLKPGVYAPEPVRLVLNTSGLFR